MESAAYHSGYNYLAVAVYSCNWRTIWKDVSVSFQSRVTARIRSSKALPNSFLECMLVLLTTYYDFRSVRIWDLYARQLQIMEYLESDYVISTLCSTRGLRSFFVLSTICHHHVTEHSCFLCDF